MTEPVAILVEELSMKAFLQTLLPRLYHGTSEGRDWHVIAFDGKQDLEQGIRPTIRSWRLPGIRFVITRDNDGGQCHALKDRLLALIPDEGLRGATSRARIRIVCEQLESWLWSDTKALTTAFPAAKRHRNFRSWAKRDPDSMTNADELLAAVTSTRAKTRRAEAIATHIQRNRSRSRSFAVFLQVLDAWLQGNHDV